MTPQLTPKQNEFNRLTKAISELYHDISTHLGISDSVFDIFYAIVALGDGCCQRDICDYAFTSKQTIHSAIHKLEKDGLICLRSGKGREMHIFLTEKGNRFRRAQRSSWRSLCLVSSRRRYRSVSWSRRSKALLPSSTRLLMASWTWKLEIRS